MQRLIPGTAHGAVDEAFIYLTKRVRVPRENVVAVRPTRDGKGATVITERGAMRVVEDYADIVRILYGDGDDPGGAQRFGANIGAEVEAARGGVAK